MKISDRIKQFNESGFSYPNSMKIQELKNSYLQNTHRLKEHFLNEDTYLNRDEKKNYRIVSWNVRYWTDVHDRPSIKEIVDTLVLLKPDIVCLQEATLGSNIYYESDPHLFTEEMIKLKNLYKIISVCSVIPSWFSDFYGNMILVRNDIYELFMRDDDYIFNQYICSKGDNRCSFNQQTRYFSNIPKTNDVVKNGITLRTQSSTNENKCYVKVSFPDFDLICLHLDAYTTNARIEQLKQVNEEITRQTIVIGDFNFFNYEEFEKSFEDKFKKDVENFHEQRNNIVSQNREYNYLTKELKWEELKSYEQVKYSQWALTRVDHIFLVKSLNIQLTKLIYYPSNASDHLPIVFDFGPKNLIKYEAPKQTHRDPYISIEKRTWYNSQPIEAYDWVLLDKSFNPKYANSDPFLTGNSGMHLGNDGIYLANNPSEAINYGRKINSIHFSYSIFNQILLLFTFEGIAFENVPTYSKLPYDKNLDTTYPIICRDNAIICKITPKAFDGNRTKYIDPVKITIVSLEERRESVKFTYVQDTTMLQKYREAVERLFLLDKERNKYTKNKLSKMCINLKNAVDHLEKKSFSHEINFSWDKVRIEDWGRGYGYDIVFDIPIKTPNQTAGLLTQTYNKYQKYKLRYNGMRAEYNLR